MILNEALATALKERRQHLGLSQRAFARQLGLSQAMLSALERGTRRSDGLDYLERVARGLDLLPLSDLLAELEARVRARNGTRVRRG